MQCSAYSRIEYFIVKVFQNIEHGVLQMGEHGVLQMGEHGAERIDEHGRPMKRTYIAPRKGKHGALMTYEHGLLEIMSNNNLRWVSTEYVMTWVIMMTWVSMMEFYHMCFSAALCKLGIDEVPVDGIQILEPDMHFDARLIEEELFTGGQHGDCSRLGTHFHVN